MSSGGEESNGRWEVVDDDADMVHSLDRHVPRLAGNARLSKLTVLTELDVRNPRITFEICETTSRIRWIISRIHQFLCGT
jgi:hypothetical protein